jgi:hypothetical protein
MLADDDIRELLGSRLPELRPDVEAELERVLGRAASRTRTRRAAYVAGLVAAVVAGVLVLGHDWRLSAPAPEPADEPPVHARALSNHGWYAQPADLTPGRYQAWFLGWGDVAIEMDVPDGWGQDDIYALATGPGNRADTRRIDLFDHVRSIQPDPCVDELVRPGPGALGLAREVASLARTTSTGPTPVTLDGHPGYFVRLEDPRRPRATQHCTGGVALRELRAGVVGAVDLPGWTSLIWVLDVGEDRAVVSASYGPDGTPDQEAELVRMVESALFDPS